WLRLRGKLTAEHLRKNPLFLRLLVFSGFLPYLAVWTGWWTREIGRQPWVVYNLMRTWQGVSHMGVTAESFWLIGYIIFELMVWGGAWYFFTRVIQKGPDMTSPVIGASDHDAHPSGGGIAKPTFAKPTMNKLD
ncbi:cytochrome ubiquinol oxidase subunit I, partial [Acidithiobacillus thiooxidans]|uniref:cytochrome ubiquinol oxidase subunit I n=2 Tax=Acidithiobacillus TaxID=119977 RepID=UPI001C0781AC